ncbi:galactokinase [Fodinibius roseus]|uniref:Galactokinase n=1 Tax=Fodinibius roseus TaxID=1194090 RepID=A0A1M4TTA3_9BACT|nr:galactokinase [Fodinibius roseus]SHE47701.1 galactokinase [Fodinibius roseus]
MQKLKKIVAEFYQRYEGDPILVQSPGRVNLIGEHTDYNDGFVLPAAIDKHIFLALAENESNRGRFYAIDPGETFEADISGQLSKSGKGWPDYLLGVVDQLRRHGYDPGGFDCVFGGNIPIGAGLSSSAALEGGMLFGLSRLFEWEIPPVEMAKMAQKAENDFVGVQCGIMDQFVSLNGKKDHAMKLDCRSLEYEFYPLKRRDIHIVLCDTRIRRELASSEYNVRRSQCEEGVRILQQHEPGINSLREVSPELLNRHGQKMDPVVFKRCTYILEENKRVQDACRDLEENDIHAFGQRMYASHTGLRDQYEVSCAELDILVDAARTIDGVLGARMMGGGFGGCTINLVEDRYLDSFKERISQRYQKITGQPIAIYQAKISAGTQLVDLPKAKTDKEL